LCSADNVVAALQFADENNNKQMLWRRWHKDTGKTMPVVSLFDSQFTFRTFSRDCRHLLASKGMDGWVWRIYSTVTGQQTAEISNSFPGPDFFVSGSDLIYLSPAGGRSIAGRLKIDPPRLVAINLIEGRGLWARPIGEAEYFGPHPGNSPDRSMEQTGIGRK
jgi:hypothetical protein